MNLFVFKFEDKFWGLLIKNSVVIKVISKSDFNRFSDLPIYSLKEYEEYPSRIIKLSIAPILLNSKLTPLESYVKILSEALKKYNFN